MAPLRQTLFISDLHLEEDNPEMTTAFFQLLTKCNTSAVDALYILGDLFEAWIGDDDDTPFHRSIINALHTATQQGLPIYFLHGNRDFLIGKKFLKATGCQLLAEAQRIALYGTPVLLMHGDTLCTADQAYLAWRKKARNPFLHTLLFLIWPLSLRRRFAQTMREKSKQHTQQMTTDIMDVSQAEVARIMQHYQVHHLIHGHTHRPAFHHFTLDQTPATRIVLGAWHTRSHIVAWDTSGQQKVLTVEDFLG